MATPASSGGRGPNVRTVTQHLGPRVPGAGGHRWACHVHAAPRAPANARYCTAKDHADWGRGLAWNSGLVGGTGARAPRASERREVCTPLCRCLRPTSPGFHRIPWAPPAWPRGSRAHVSTGLPQRAGSAPEPRGLNRGRWVSPCLPPLAPRSSQTATDPAPPRADSPVTAPLAAAARPAVAATRGPASRPRRGHGSLLLFSVKRVTALWFWGLHACGGSRQRWGQIKPLSWSSGDTKGVARVSAFLVAAPSWCEDAAAVFGMLGGRCPVNTGPHL